MQPNNYSFLGWGPLVPPRAKRLLTPAYELTVWNRSPQRSEPFATQGVFVAKTAAEAAARSDVVITMLSDPAAVHEVFSEIAPALRPGAHLVEASTIGPEALTDVLKALPSGVSLVDAPVMGSSDRAANGSLTLFAGGDLEPVMDVLERFGTVIPCGPIGAGAALKVVLISAVVASVTAIAEAMTVADAYGLPQDLVQRAMSQSLLAGVAGRAFGVGANYPIRLAAKDVALTLETRDLSMARAVHERLTASPDVMNDDLGRIVDSIRALEASR
jgi:3-hydroxyisobutyrate dehydrogenase